MAAEPIQALIKAQLTGVAMPPDPSLTTAPPPTVGDGSGITISVDSAGTTVTDVDGKENGLSWSPGQTASITRRMTRSVTVDGQSVKFCTGAYKVKSKSKAAGTTKVKVTKTNPDGTASTTEYTNIPTTASTTITINVHDGTSDAPVVDEYGDGSKIFVIAQAGPAAPDPTIVEQLKALFEGLNVRPGIKNRLLRALEPLEADDTDQAAITNLELLIKAQTGVKLSLDQGAQMLELLDTLKYD